MREFGLVMEPSPGYTARLAGEIEALGFDILLCPDTQNLSPDPYGQLSLAAAATTRLKLATGVTNPYTRDPAVTAGAFATLHLESGGRAICGIGRGDSSAAHIGRRNAKTDELRLYIDGKKSGAVVWTSSLSSINDVNAWLGRSQYDHDPELSAVFHEFRMYGAALSDAEVASSFAGGPDPVFLAY